MRSKGFTLIEVLVVIAIIGILAGMLMPVYSRARHMSHKAVCLSNLRQIGLAIRMYCDDWDGRMPHQSFLSRFHETYSVDTGTWDECNPDPVTGYDPPYHYWDEALAPYIKSPDIWFCPSVSRSEKVAKPETANYRILTFEENKGTYACNYMTPLRRHGFERQRIRISWSRPETFYDPAKVSLVWDLRHWGVPNSHNVPLPHFAGLNVLFADGHAEIRRGIGNIPTKSNYYIGKSWEGFYPPDY